ncbi:MAG: TetR family transcriptional regulator [Emcibacteraceae bacterium]|nr:TetR family transcriptional regulator [Emcibacteraceae bacterium]MDG1994912.1 TetR family transcriptional regulator [Emcibacteraceae bacterium]
MQNSINYEEVDKTNSDKKQVFIDATICSLANHGYKGTTVRQIAKYAGLAPGLLTHYFEGKEVLIAASYKYLSQRFLDDFQNSIDGSEKDPIKVLKAFFKNIFGPANLGSPFLRIWLSFWTLTLTEPSLRITHKEIQGQYIKSIEKLLIAAHNLSNPNEALVDSYELAIGVMAILDGLWLECCLDPDALSQNDNLKIVYKFVESTTGISLK